MTIVEAMIGKAQHALQYRRQRRNWGRGQIYLIIDFFFVF